MTAFLGVETSLTGRRWVGPHAIIAADAIRADDPAIRFVGEDGALTLESLPGVIREAVDTEQLVITRAVSHDG